MAKNFEQINQSAYVTGNIMDWTNALTRLSGVPLDITEVYNSYADAVNYAATNPVAYEGQLIAVTENGDTTVYVITPKSQGTYNIDVGGSIQEVAIYIKEVGSAPAADGETIEVVDGKLRLVGLDEIDSSKTYQPILVDGRLEWQVPSATTVDGLSTRLSVVEEGLTDITSVVGDSESGIIHDLANIAEKADQNSADIASESEARAKADEDLEAALKTYVGEQIGSQAHFRAQVVDSSEDVKDATTLYLIKSAEEGEDQYEEWMLIDGTPVKIGTTATDLSGYVTSSELETKLQAQLSTIQESITNVAQDHESDIESISSDLNDFKTNVQQTYAKSSDVETTTENLQAQIDDLVNNKADSSVVADITSAMEAATKAQTTADTNSAAISDLQDSTTDLEASVASLEENKVDKITGWTLLSPENQDKLAALTVNNGNIELSGKVTAENVDGLGSFLTQNRDSISGLLSVSDEKKLDSVESGAQANIIEGVCINGTPLTISKTDKTVNIPFATNNTYGVVLSSQQENKVSVEPDGTMVVNSLNVNKLVQTEGDTLVLNGGNSSV